MGAVECRKIRRGYARARRLRARHDADTVTLTTPVRNRRGVVQGTRQGTRWLTSDLFIAEPQVNLLFGLAKHFQLSIGGGYRFTGAEQSTTIGSPARAAASRCESGRPGKAFLLHAREVWQQHTRRLRQSRSRLAIRSRPTMTHRRSTGTCRLHYRSRARQRRIQGRVRRRRNPDDGIFEREVPEKGPNTLRQ